MSENKNFNLENIANLLNKVIIKTVKEMNDSGIIDNLEIKKKNITEYEGKLRVSGMEMFNESTYISTLSYYLSKNDLEKHKAAGAVIIYIRKDQAPGFLKLLGYREFNDESDKSVMEACGVFFKVIAENFKKRLVAEGYTELVMSEHSNFFNDVFVGVDFDKKQYDEYELDFSIKGERAMVFDMSLAPIPQG